jgi:hypothetical protein
MIWWRKCPATTSVPIVRHGIQVGDFDTLSNFPHFKLTGSCCSLGIMECTFPLFDYAASRHRSTVPSLLGRAGTDEKIQLGVFLCMRCAAIHRKLGTHISKVKSLSMDSWSNEQVEVCSRFSRCRRHHESLMDAFRI